ncbi:DUF5110 domain-containing protein [Fictibacillus sp. KU28468]|nr:DUF5110 domain-containing protein [Fictibacillus sp. KU28468]UZJ77430.1 DUF5110 domain-containing protein [Fictibacillus sp. KU28468]
MPNFVKAGYILPHGTVKPNSAVKETKMTFHVYAELDGSTEYSLDEDDAKTFAYEDNHFAEININCSFSKNLIKIELNQESSGYTPDCTEY